MRFNCNPEDERLNVEDNRSSFVFAHIRTSISLLDEKYSKRVITFISAFKVIDYMLDIFHNGIIIKELLITNNLVANEEQK